MMPSEIVEAVRERDALAELVKKLTRDVIPASPDERTFSSTRADVELLDAYRYTPLTEAEAALVRRITKIVEPES